MNYEVVMEELNILAELKNELVAINGLKEKMEKVNSHCSEKDPYITKFFECVGDLDLSEAGMAIELKRVGLIIGMARSILKNN